MNIFDSHTHLNDDAFWGQEDAYYNHAKKLGVTYLAQVGSNTVLNERAIALAEKYDHMYAIVGWHPEDSKNYDEAAEEKLIEQLNHPKVVALGEIGLDYHWDSSPKKVQQKVFAKQIQIAAEHNLPISIHTREALEDTYDILKNAGLPTIKGVLHSFSGDVDWMDKFLALGLNISFSGVASFKKTKDIHEAVKQVPLDRIMVETDAPYLSPEPLRGQQNEPAYALYVLEALARFKDMNPATLAKYTFENTCKLYGIKHEKN